MPESSLESFVGMHASLNAGEKKKASYETVHLRKNGTRYPAKAYLQLTTFMNKPAFLATVLDLSENRASEEALSKSEEKYRAIFENAQIGMFQTAINDGKMLECNERAAQALGYTNRFDCIKSFISTEHYVDQGERKKMLSELNKNGAVENFEAQLELDNGSVIWIRFSAKLNPEKGCLDGVVEDVTEEKRIQMQLRDSFKEIVRVVSRTVSARDPYTAGHQIRVAQLAVAIAEEMGLNKDQVKGVWMGAKIHDIGKIQIPAELLSKPTKLTRAEFEIMRSHPKAGFNILKGIEFPWPITQMVHQHHERMDGSGYPQGLKGEEIQMEARIISVADTVEAMASHRPYRPALGVKKALEEITAQSGKHYDPLPVEACVELFRGGNFSFKHKA
jgi:PAS domain S-box-containing protein/putative nucleotidyltransferase with HDIG domain